MFGIKTLLVGSGAVAVLWAMNSHASAGDVVSNVKNGVSAVQNGAQAVSNGYSTVQNGYSSLSNGLKSLNQASGSIGTDTSGNPGGAAASIIPASARPGQTVTINAPTCIQPTMGSAWSTVFSPNEVPLSRAAQGSGLSGTATIASNAQNGSWQVRITCGTGGNQVSGSTSITVFGGASPTTTPVRPPRAGAGGSIMKGDLGMTAGGVALVAGGVGYGLWSLRRRDAASGTRVG